LIDLWVWTLSHGQPFSLLRITTISARSLISKLSLADDVITDICKKLIIRHPHVFGSVEADNVETVLKNWDTIKKETKGQETYSDTLKSVPKNFPALMRAQKLSKRAARAGIEYDNAHDNQHT